MSRQLEKELYDTQIEALKMRNSSEVQSLVHDLKSPLTTAEGLISLAEMMEKDELLKEYFRKISSSLRSMGLMISEILYENKKAPMEVGDLMRMVLAQVSILVPNEALKYVNACPEIRHVAGGDGAHVGAGVFGTPVYGAWPCVYPAGG